MTNVQILSENVGSNKIVKPLNVKEYASGFKYNFDPWYALTTFGAAQSLIMLNTLVKSCKKTRILCRKICFSFENCPLRLTPSQVYWSVS